MSAQEWMENCLRDLRRQKLELWATEETGISSAEYQREDGYTEKEFQKSAQDTLGIFGHLFTFYFHFYIAQILRCAFAWAQWEAFRLSKNTNWGKNNFWETITTRELWAITAALKGLGNVWLLTINNGETYFNTLGVQERLQKATLYE